MKKMIGYSGSFEPGVYDKHKKEVEKMISKYNNRDMKTGHEKPRQAKHEKRFVLVTLSAIQIDGEVVQVGSTISLEQLQKIHPNMRYHFFDCSSSISNDVMKKVESPEIRRKIESLFPHEKKSEKESEV